MGGIEVEEEVTEPAQLGGIEVEEEVRELAQFGGVEVEEEDRSPSNSVGGRMRQCQTRIGMIRRKDWRRLQQQQTL